MPDYTDNQSRAAYDRYVADTRNQYREAFYRWLISKQGEMPRHPLVYTYEFWRNERARFGISVSNCV